jgi:hypothetical protein
MVLPAMQRCQGPRSHVAEYRKMEMVDVEVQDVELRGARTHLVEHQHVIRNIVAAGALEPDRTGAARNELSSGDGIFGCKQGYLVAHRN